jgi:uronate dehydrogenase
VFGEMLGSLYAYKHGLEIFLIRIGHATSRPSDFCDLAMWISPRDLANVHFEIVYGVSGNTRSWYDNSNAERLGYRPLDNAESYAAEVLAQKGSVTERRHYQGGSYTQID